MIGRLSVGLLLLALAGCDSFQPTASDEGSSCLSGDFAIASKALCLMDDAACYQLDDGQWCTGPRAGDGNGFN